jgi:hypothetical protein
MDAETVAKGLSKKIGDSGFELSRGAHWPWSYVLHYRGEAIGGVDIEAIQLAKKLLKDHNA